MSVVAEVGGAGEQTVGVGWRLRFQIPGPPGRRLSLRAVSLEGSSNTRSSPASVWLGGQEVSSARYRADDARRCGAGFDLLAQAADVWPDENRGLEFVHIVCQGNACQLAVGNDNAGALHQVR